MPAGKEDPAGAEAGRARCTSAPIRHLTDGRLSCLCRSFGRSCAIWASMMQAWLKGWQEQRGRMAGHTTQNSWSNLSPYVSDSHQWLPYKCIFILDRQYTGMLLPAICFSWSDFGIHVAQLPRSTVEWRFLANILHSGIQDMDYGGFAVVVNIAFPTCSELALVMLPHRKGLE